MSEETIRDLDKRVSKIENNIKIAVVIALFFGVGGTFGYTLINNAQRRITDLQANVVIVEKMLEEGTDKIIKQELESIQEMRDLAPEILLDSIITVADINISQSYLRIGDLQVCWGSEIVRPEPTNPRIAKFNFTFSKEFSSKPVVSTSVDADHNGCIYNVYNFSLNNSRYNGNVLENRNRECPDTPIKIDFIAIGSWR